MSSLSGPFYLTFPFMAWSCLSLCPPDKILLLFERSACVTTTVKHSGTLSAHFNTPNSVSQRLGSALPRHSWRLRSKESDCAFVYGYSRVSFYLTHHLFILLNAFAPVSLAELWILLLLDFHFSAHQSPLDLMC